MDFQNKDYSQKDTENFSASPAEQEHYQEEQYAGGNRKSKLPPLETSSGNDGLKRQLNQMNIEDMNQDSGADAVEE